MSHPRPQPIVLLRHQLFVPSEVFITEQARALRQFAPLLVGRALAGPAPVNVNYCVPAHAGSWRRLSYTLHRDPELFLPQLRQYRPVLIHAHFGVEAVYGIKIAEALGVPLITTFHGFDASLTTGRLLMSGKPSWLNYVLHRSRLRRRGTLFICVSQFIRDKLIELGFPEDRLTVHYIGIDPSLFAPAESEASERIVLHVARLVEKKGTADLLQAFARLTDKHADCKLVVIGDGPLRGRLMRRAQELRVSQRVAWLGALPHAEVRQWMRRASIFCLPSRTAASGDAEGLGQVLLEAAASGLPTVATRHGGIPEAVIDGRTGFLVPERTTGALAEALDALLTAPSVCREFGRRAIEMVRARFDISQQTRALEQLYASVL